MRRLGSPASSTAKILLDSRSSGRIANNFEGSVQARAARCGEPHEDQDGPVTPDTAPRSPATTGEQLTFAAGSPSQIAVGEILEVRDEGAIRGGGGNKALILRLKDGDVGMMMTPADHHSTLRTETLCTTTSAGPSHEPT